MVGPLLLVLRGFYISILLLLKMYQACPMHNLFEGFVVWFIILVGGIFSNTVLWGACRTSCYIIKKIFFYYLFSVLLTENQAMHTWKMEMWNCSSLTNMGITSIICLLHVQV